MLEDAAGDARVFDEGHDVHGATATWADQYVDGEAPFQQRRPVKAAGTRRIVRAGGVGAVYHGLVMLVMRRDRTLDFAWDKTEGQNGDVLHLTITVTAQSAIGGGHAVLITSTMGQRIAMWPGLIVEH